jgi:hypothetical protein
VEWSGVGDGRREIVLPKELNPPGNKRRNIYDSQHELFSYRHEALSCTLEQSGVQDEVNWGGGGFEGTAGAAVRSRKVWQRLKYRG